MDPPRRLSEDPLLAAGQSVGRSLTAARSSVEGLEVGCVQVETGLYACPSEVLMREWGWENHLLEPEEAFIQNDLEPADPIQIRDGLQVYEMLLNGVAQRTRTHLELLENTPPLSTAEIEYFHQHPALWRATVAFRSTPAGRARRDRLRDEIGRYTDVRDRRHLVLRNGYFYFEDPITADWAASHLYLRDLFDEERIVLERGSERSTLVRGSGGHYYYEDPAYGGYRARLVVFDRVGLPDELETGGSYRLNDLRRRYGLENVVVGEESGAGRDGEARFLDGSTYPARLVRREQQEPWLAVVASEGDLRKTLSESRVHDVVIYGIIDTTYQMVRENLFFDEPANEVGQQDGIMRLAFMNAFQEGRETYTVNGVTYSIYDELGRPRPPQVCIDFITDAVERYTGRWWPTREERNEHRSWGTINIRDYMPYRQVRRLVDLALEHPEVAGLYTYKEEDHVPYTQRSGFFRNIWNTRDHYRIGDVIVIYGLRPDNRNHWHSFYVFDTDPVFGMPIAIVDQAGHAAIRTLHDVMSRSPRRSIRYVVRWNPWWVMAPQAAEAAAEVRRAAERIADDHAIDALASGGTDEN
ncbi:MAG: hypothetical protein KC561_04985 [Myxococcales bacterium]|nr:hypothetical protein [Myxococcales bacterium]